MDEAIRLLGVMNQPCQDASHPRTIAAAPDPAHESATPIVNGLHITQPGVMLIYMKLKQTGVALCPPKPALAVRRLLSPAQARNLTAIFKVLASPTRVRLLHALVKETELGVNELCAAIGMKPQAVSNQLQRLSARGIVDTRRNGNQILYRIVDPCVPALLDQGLCLAEDVKNRKR